MLIDGESLKSEITAGAIVGFNRSRKIERRFHPEISHAIFHDLEVNGDDAGHFNSATE
jgi:hypothetical protein